MLLRYARNDGASLIVDGNLLEVRRRHRRDEAAGGLGLGLAVVRGYVEWHGGTVSADSPGLGHGSTFTIRLPYGDANTCFGGG